MPDLSPQDAFRKWANATCVRSDRCWGGVGCLHRSYLDWAIENAAPLVSRETFDALILDSGHLITDVQGDSFAVGMTFRSDVKASVIG